ncbi:MAG: hypothetical protein FWG63_06855 [Defluviitaleaceae bacterium]|nr:hypothetical protein [Defluviitaleaceae bacterium]
MNINIGYNTLPNSSRTAGFGRRSSSIYRNGNNTELNNKLNNLTDAKQINSTKHVVVDISAEGKGLLADFLYGEDNLTLGNHYNAYLKELAQSENGITGALEEIDESWFLKGSEGHLFSNPRSFIEFERESYFGLAHRLFFIMSRNTFDNTSISQSFSNLASKFIEIRDLFQRNFTGAELDELLGELDLAKEQAILFHAHNHARSFLRDMRQEMFAMLHNNPSPDLWGRWSQLMDKLDEMREQLKEVLIHFGQLIVSFAIENGGFDPSRDAGRIGLNNDLDNIANDFRNSFFANL